MRVSLSWKIRERLEQIIHELAIELGIKVLKLAMNPGHLHLFVSACPTIPAHKIVKKEDKGKQFLLLKTRVSRIT